jgi:hypothetical protein
MSSLALRLMGYIREWATLTLPSLFSAWLLQAYRRPLKFLVGLVIVPLALIFLTTQLMNVALWRQQTLRNLQVTARLAAEIVEGSLGETFRFEEMIAAQPGFVEAVQRGERSTLTRQLIGSLTLIPHVDRALVTSAEGKVLATAPDQPELIGTDVSQSEPFQGARRGGWHPYVSAVHLREGPEIEKVVGIVLPILHDGTPAGLLQLQHRVETVKLWLQKIRIDPQGFLYVVDHEDQLVVYPFQVLPGKPKAVSDWPPVALPLSPDGGSLAFRDARTGRRWLSGVYPIGELGWRVVAVQPEAAALSVLHRVLWPTGILVGLLCVLLALVSRQWAKLQESSLRLLSQNTKLLKQLQQEETLKRMRGSGPSAGGAGGTG